MSKRKPAQVFHPGDYIAEFLADRGQTAEVLHCRRGKGSRWHWSEAEVTELLSGHRAVDAFMAFHLLPLWGTSVELWLNLQACWDALPDRRSWPDAAE